MFTVKYRHISRVFNSGSELSWESTGFASRGSSVQVRPAPLNGTSDSSNRIMKGSVNLRSVRAGTGDKSGRLGPGCSPSWAVQSSPKMLKIAPLVQFPAVNILVAVRQRFQVA